MDKEKKVYQVFQSISGDYDRMNDIISLRQHRRWKRQMVEQAAAERPGRILDLCCGTGDISLLLGRRLPEGQVYGLDFSENMLAVARERLEAEGLPNVRFLRGDAMELPWEDQVFDCAVISFGLRNVPDYERVLSELHRVLRPGGRLFCLDSSYPTFPLVRPCFRLYFKFIMPFLGRSVANKEAEYQWLNDSTEAFLSKEQLTELFRKTGFEDVTCRSYLLGSAALHQGRVGFTPS